MQESVVDILAYLIDDVLPNYEQTEANFEQMMHSLCNAGFAENNVGRAMNWFFSLADIPRPNLPKEDQSVRIFSTQESKYIDAKGQDYLRRLLHIGALDNVLLEMVIDKSLALEERLDIETLRWVAHLVVMNNVASNDPIQLAWQQAYLYTDDSITIH